MVNGPNKTSLHSSPFFVLGATPRDNRARISELADDRSLTGNEEACRSARSTLSAPRTRLSAEMAWFPGLSPARANQLLESVETRPLEIVGNTGIPALARSNAIAAVFDYLDNRFTESQISQLILALSTSSELIKADEVLRDLNEDRGVSGFPEIKATDAIAEEISARIRAYSRAVIGCLNRLDTLKLIRTVSQTVQNVLSSNAGATPHLLEEIIDAYALEAEIFFDAEAKIINDLLALLKNDAASKKTTSPRVKSALEACLENWKRVADPIIKISQARGTNHEASASVAFSIRSLGVDLFNEHDLLEVSTWLTELNARTFGDLAAIADTVQADQETLADIQLKRQNSAKEQEELDQQIAFDAKFGLFKDQIFKISKGIIRFNYDEYSLLDITRAKWGAIRKSTNGIPTGTDYVIAFGTNSTETIIRFSNNEKLYNDITSRLWKAVAWRIMSSSLSTLKAGGSIRFGRGTLKDTGMILLRQKFLSTAEPVEVPWAKMKIWSQSGSFYMGHKDEKSVQLSLSYISDANTHFLEQLIRTLFKSDNAVKMSDLT